MDISITQNVIVCPHCGDVFEHNKINGIALLEIAQSVESHKRMRCRLTLNALERILGDSKNPVFSPTKKIILDGYNDLARDIHSVLGFGNEAE